jgi:hypothetical protein
MYDAEVGFTTGLEGNNPGSGTLEWQRARTRLFGGVELKGNEIDYGAYGFRGFAEIEKRGSLGGEARYVRHVGGFGLFGSVGGVLFPKSLLGVGIGARYVIALGDTWGVFLEPGFSAMPIGGDLPSGSVLLWGSFSVGLRLGV